MANTPTPKRDPEHPYFIPVAFDQGETHDGRTIRADVIVRPARPAENVDFGMFLTAEPQGKPDERLSCDLSRETVVKLARAAGVTAEELAGVTA